MQNSKHTISQVFIPDLREHKELNTKTYKESEYGVKPIFEYKADRVNVNRKQYKKVIGMVEKYNNAINDLEVNSDSYHEERLREFDDCMDKLRNTTIKRDAMYTLIAYAFKLAWNKRFYAERIFHNLPSPFAPS